jgi:hypothetical protein
MSDFAAKTGLTEMSLDTSDERGEGKSADADPKEKEPARKLALSEGSRIWLRDHLVTIKKEIIQEANALAREDASSKVLPKHVANAAMRFAPGERFPLEMSFRGRILTSISGITIISAILAISFGILTAFGKGDHIDVVKIFAGAVVGSTGASVAMAVRRK